MSAPSAVLTHGASGILLNSEEITVSLDSIDEGNLEYLCPAINSLLPGAVAPDYPGLYIQSVTARPEADEWILRCRVRGLQSGSTKRTALSWSEDPFGWDVASEERIELATATFAWGSRALAGFNNMRLMKVTSEDLLDGHWMKRNIEHKGIKKLGLYDRELSANESIVNPGDPIIVSLEGGWPDGRKGKIAFPRITFTETFKSLQPARTTAFPAPWPGLPPSGIPFPRPRIITITGSDLNYNWPNGWKVNNIAAKELFAGANIWLLTYYFEYVPLAEF